MYYYYFRVFNWISSVFGLIKPYSDVSGNIRGRSYWFKLWSFVVTCSFIMIYAFTIDFNFHFDIKQNLSQISDYNDLITNISIVIIDLTNSTDLLIDLYETMNTIFGSLKINNLNLKWIAFKLHFWFGITTVVYVASIVMVIIIKDFALMLVIKIPTFLTVYHLFAHLYLILSVLKIVSDHLSSMLTLGYYKFNTTENKHFKASAFKYLFDFDKGFIRCTSPGQWLDIKEICTIYDDINICIKLLEKYHGFQILLIIWSMFSTTVFGVTLIALKLVKNPSLIVVKCILPFIWCFMCCYVDDRLHKEVEVIDIVIVKHIIDFRCDRQQRNTLQNFKQLVSTERLDFTACNLFNLNCSMLLGTIVNIITYSIILIQLFVSR